MAPLDPTSASGAADAEEPTVVNRPVRYEVALERIDVAIRAVVLVTVGKWRNREQARALGINPEYDAKTLQRALEELRAAGTIDRLRTDKELFALLKRCPFLLPAAQTALALYQAVTYDDRERYFGRLPELTRLLTSLDQHAQDTQDTQDADDDTQDAGDTHDE